VARRAQLPKWSDIPWAAIVTGLVAVYGAALSTYNLRIQRKKDKRSLRLEFAFAPITKQGKKISQGLLFHISNDGHRTVFVDQVDVLVGRKYRFDSFEVDPPLPCELKEGQALVAWGAHMNSQMSCKTRDSLASYN